MYIVKTKDSAVGSALTFVYSAGDESGGSRVTIAAHLSDSQVIKPQMQRGICNKFVTACKGSRGSYRLEVAYGVTAAVRKC